MNREDIVRMAVETQLMTTGNRGGMYEDAICEFAALVAAAEREKLSKWMISRGYATGHGDTVEELLKELEWQVAEREREACAKVCKEGWKKGIGAQYQGDVFAVAIRARGEK